jgi:hypothetical protein
MTDEQEPFYARGRKPPPPRQPQPGEILFEFVRESDHEHFRCELRTHGGEWGVEAQFFVRGDLFIARRFDTRALAVQWATIERKHIEKGGD